MVPKNNPVQSCLVPLKTEKQKNVGFNPSFRTFEKEKNVQAWTHLKQKKENKKGHKKKTKCMNFEGSEWGVLRVINNPFNALESLTQITEKLTTNNSKIEHGVFVANNN